MYLENGDLVSERSYSNKIQRNDIIRVWKFTYGQKFIKGYLQVRPEYNSELVNRTNGRNVRFKNVAHSRNAIKLLK